MNTIPLISRNGNLVEIVQNVLSDERFAGYDCQVLGSSEKAVEFLQIEMPELILLDYSDPGVEPGLVLDTIMGDPWLLNGGIIAICSSFKEADAIEKTRGANIVVALPAGQFDAHFRRVMMIINENRHILFHQGIGWDIVGTISGSFKLHNDPVEARCFANLICNFLFNSNKLMSDQRLNLNMALDEMLMNAIEHGNCGISYNEKSAWLENDKPIAELIAAKCEDETVRDRKVLFEYSITSQTSRFLIADQGAGFDWKAMVNRTKTPNPFDLHGRGIIMAKRFTKNLTYNDSGNEVSFEMDHQRGVVVLTPGIFRDMEVLDVKENDVVIHQGELSSSLYYIVKGEYEVIVNNRAVAVLTPDDIFLGEMSFLLNDRRSATVRAGSAGKLIKLTKRQFVDAIKKNPHYSLFLCRLLAQRIQRLNTRSAPSSDS